MTWLLRRGPRVLPLALLLPAILAGCDWGPQVNSTLGSSGVITITYPQAGEGGRLLVVTPSSVSTMTWQGRQVTGRSDAFLPAGAWEQIVATSPLASLQALPRSTCAVVQPNSDSNAVSTGDASGSHLVIREGFRVLVDIQLPACDPHAPVVDAILEAWLAPALTRAAGEPV